MTYLDAARQILAQAGHPLHYQEITQRALQQSLITPQGQTPEATMGSRLYTDTLQEGSLFVRAGRGVFGLADWQPRGIDIQVQRIYQATRDRLHKYLRAMPFDRFEALVRELLIQMGFNEDTVQLTPRSGDGGIDVVGSYHAAGLTAVNAAVQVKRWQRNVQAPTVTSLRGSLQVHQQGIIITTSDFSKGAYAEAEAPNKTHIGLINGQQLLDLLIKHKVGVLERTLKVIDLDDDWWGEFSGQPLEVALSEEPSAPLPSSGQVSSASAAKRTGSQPPPPFELFGQAYAADTWRGLLLQVCQVLARRYPDTFADIAGAVRGRTRQYIAPQPDGMIDPLPIPDTDLYLEANQSRDTVLSIVRKMLVAFGHQAEEFHQPFAST